MPVTDTQRSYFTDLVKGVQISDNANAMQYIYGSATITEAVTADPLGIPVVWNDTDGAYEIYNTASSGQIAAAITAGSAPLGGGKSVVAVVVGNGMGAGLNPADIDFTAGADVTVLHRGEGSVGVVVEGINFTVAGATSQANIDLFTAQLEAQGIMVIETAEVIDPSYV